MAAEQQQRIIQEMMSKMQADAEERSDLERQLVLAQQSDAEAQLKLRNLHAGFAAREQELENTIAKQAAAMDVMRMAFTKAKEALSTFAQGSCDVLVAIETDIEKAESAERGWLNAPPHHESDAYQRDER